MAYQPFPKPIGGIISELTTGATPITLATAGVDYVLLAVQFSDAAQLPEAPGVIILVENTSVMSVSMGKELEFRFIGNGVVAGDPLVFTSLGFGAPLDGAIGNGTQTVTGGLPLGLGRFVPGNDERFLENPASPSLAFPAIVPKTLQGLLVARGLNNNTSVVARSILRQIPVDESGNPL